jgi:hypothetical protein
VRLWGRVTAPEPARFEGDVSLRAAWARRGLALAGRVSDPARCVVLERRAVGGPAVLMERARDAVRQAIGRALPADRAAIVLAFATGEQAGIGPTDVEVFRIAGLSHLMAVSGLNVAIIAGLALVGLRWLLGRSAWIGLGFGAERASVVLAGAAGGGLRRLRGGPAVGAARGADDAGGAAGGGAASSGRRADLGGLGGDRPGGLAPELGR